MARYIVRLLFWLCIVILFVSVITFAFAHAVPGGPFSGEKKLPKPNLAQLEKKYRLDDPVWKQYLNYMGDILIPRITGEPIGGSLREDYLIGNIPLASIYTLQWMNFGPSYKNQARSVNDIFRENLCHFFRHAKGGVQTGQVLTGKSDFLRIIGMGHSPRRASAVCMRLRPRQDKQQQARRR